MKIYIPFLSMIVFLFSSCIVDPCADVSCKNGYCVDGTCICDEGYDGTYCQRSTAPPKPTGFTVTRIEITNFPVCYADGTPIDNEFAGDNPDLRVKMANPSSGTFTTRQTHNNVHVDFRNLNWKMKNSQTHPTRLSIYDRDDLGAVYADKLLVSIEFDLDDLEAERDNAFSTQIQDKFSDNCYPYGSKSWVRVYFELIY